MEEKICNCDKKCKMCNDTGRVTRKLLNNLVEACNHCRIADLEQEACEAEWERLRALNPKGNSK